MTRWLNPPSIQIDSLSALGLHPLVAETLIRRGVDSPAAARAFLSPDEIPPAQFPDVERAVDLIQRALARKEKICVWGDFDVDGQTSTALLVQTLQALGADVRYYVPIRGKESHGVHIESLTPILDSGVTLLLTCDTGVTAHEAVAYAKSRGATVILTDHHDLGNTLPNADVILNPKTLPKDHRLKNLAGVGVAYKLAEALLESCKLQVAGYKSQVASDTLLDLVALGLIADVALLQGETRALAQKGIEQLRNTQRLGLKAIAELAGATLETLSEETIGFTFAPRLNALGRLGDANPAIELLLTEDPVRANVLANQIEGLNQQRRLLTAQVYQAAEAQLKESPALLDEPVLVLAHSGWPGGVVGIVANKLVEKYHKPAILFNENDGILRGSARSVEGLHIAEAIASQSALLRGFGGHPMAAGMSLDADKLSDFRRGLGKAVEKQLGQIIREEPTLQIDAWLNLNEATLELAGALEALSPFGAGNPPLTFATRSVTLKSAANIGKTREHIRLNVADEKGCAQSVLWWGGAGEELPETGAKFDVAYTLRASTFRGEKQVALQFKEFRMAAESPVEIQTPKYEVIDWRKEAGELAGLQVWAEGADKAKGLPRHALTQSEDLVIYTAPPSRRVLRAALDEAQPKRIYFVGALPPLETAEEFLTRLAGICKFVMNQRGGKVSLAEIAASMAAREEAAQLGLEWLSSGGGHLHVRVEDGQVQMEKGSGEKNPYVQMELLTALRGALKETAAYREYLGISRLVF
ncbi:MAG: single-stranded-DNA-specific exonuclease RecJ [Anaerolineales bacterium]